MTPDSPSARGPDAAERPGPAARLKLDVKTLGTWEGTVPPSEARYLITAFGIVGSVVTGTVGALLTLRIARGSAAVAIAELIVALAAMVLIALCGSGRHRACAQQQASEDSCRAFAKALSWPAESRRQPETVAAASPAGDDQARTGTPVVEKRPPP